MLDKETSKKLKNFTFLIVLKRLKESEIANIMKDIISNKIQSVICSIKINF